MTEQTPEIKKATSLCDSKPGVWKDGAFYEYTPQMAAEMFNHYRKYFSIDEKFVKNSDI